MRQLLSKYIKYVVPYTRARLRHVDREQARGRNVDRAAGGAGADDGHAQPLERREAVGNRERVEEGLKDASSATADFTFGLGSPDLVRNNVEDQITKAQELLMEQGVGMRDPAWWEASRRLAEQAADQLEGEYPDVAEYFRNRARMFSERMAAKF